MYTYHDAAICKACTMHIFEDEVAGALLELVNRFNSPRQDEVLLRAAGVTLDRALFPLLARIGMQGALGIAELADQVDRDPSTISRQVAKLECMGLVARRPGAVDQRIRQAVITPQGEEWVARITEARRRLLKILFEDWSDEDRRNLPRLARKLALAMKNAEAGLAEKALGEASSSEPEA